MNRFPTDPSKAELWKSILGLDVDKQIHGTICIEHFTDDDFKIVNRATGKFILKSNARPKAIQNMNNVLVPVETVEILEPISMNMCCKRCTEKVTETEVMLDQSNIKIKKLEGKILELRKKVKGLQDRSYSLAKSNAHSKATLERIKIEKVDPKIEKLSKVCARFQNNCGY